jgi:coenzyme Q-binding protein COQ10
MTEIKKSILINAPINKVFDFASNYLKWQEFFVGISDIRPITDITDDNGARFLYKVQLMGMKVSVGTEFQQFKRNKGWIGQSFKGLDAQTQWIFKESDGETEFTYIQRYKLPFYMGGNLIDKKFITPQWNKIIEESLNNLKRLTE